MSYIGKGLRTRKETIENMDRAEPPSSPLSVTWKPIVDLDGALKELLTNEPRRFWADQALIDSETVSFLIMDMQMASEYMTARVDGFSSDERAAQISRPLLAQAALIAMVKAGRITTQSLPWMRLERGETIYRSPGAKPEFRLNFAAYRPRALPTMVNVTTMGDTQEQFILVADPMDAAKNISTEIGRIEADTSLLKIALDRATDAVRSVSAAGKSDGMTAWDQERWMKDQIDKKAAEASAIERESLRQSLFGEIRREREWSARRNGQSRMYVYGGAVWIKRDEPKPIERAAPGVRKIDLSDDDD